MLGPFTFTFTLESEEFEKSEKVGCLRCAADLYMTMITTRAPDGANKFNLLITVQICQNVMFQSMAGNVFPSIPLQCHSTH